MKEYRRQMDELYYTEQGKRALVQSLTAEQPVRQNRRPARRTALLILAAALAAITTAAAVPRLLNGDGGNVLHFYSGDYWVERDEETGNVVRVSDHSPEFGAGVLREENGRLFFVVDETERDITNQVSETEGFAAVVEDAGGYTHYFVVGGTPGDYGYTEILYQGKTRIFGWSDNAGTFVPASEYTREELRQAKQSPEFWGLDYHKGEDGVERNIGYSVYKPWLLDGYEELGFVREYQPEFGQWDSFHLPGAEPELD